jgi:hypothetical protein
MNLDLPVFDPHMFHLKPSFSMINTNGIAFNRSRLMGQVGPDNVASVYHYFYKSRQEYIKKRIRGGGTNGFDLTSMRLATSGRDPYNNTIPHGTTFDDSGWETLKKNCPKYDLYDELYPAVNGARGSNDEKKFFPEIEATLPHDSHPVVVKHVPVANKNPVVANAVPAPKNAGIKNTNDKR